MQPANANKSQRETASQRSLCAGLFAAQFACARAEGMSAMRMRMHAEQADAAAAALN
jgi:hypothetical protein